MAKTITEINTDASIVTVGDNTLFVGDDSGSTFGIPASKNRDYLKNTFPEMGAGFGSDDLLIRTQGTGGIVAGSAGATLDDSNNLGNINTIGLTGGQIAFPATQNPSANANTFDDYEEGTFTPVLTRSSTAPTITSYVTRQAEYTKKGNEVSINISMQINGSNITTAGSGVCIITGCPFSASIIYTPGSVGFNDLFSSTGASSCVIVGSTIYFTGIGPTQGYINEDYNNIAGSHYLSLQLTFTT